MNPEFLVELYRLNTTMETILWVMYGILGLISIQTVSRLYEGWKVRSNAKFRNVIENYYNRGEFSVVTSGCELKLSRHPNDSWAYWWKGKGHYKLGEFEDAKMAFNKLLAVEPGWYNSVTPWLEEIKNRTEPKEDSTDETQPDNKPNPHTSGPVI